MDEQAVFAYLKRQKKAALLEYLKAAFQHLNAKQRQAVFADAIPKPARKTVDGEHLRQEIDQFRSDSMARRYYAPFNVNSRNFMHVPEKTRQWCDHFARFVADASELTARNDHAQAVACFAVLYELLRAMESGKEIISAEEAGCWLIPANEQNWLKAYLTSLAATASPEAFTAAALPMIERDGLHSFASRVYPSAIAVGNPQQKAHLQTQLRQQGIRTGPTS